MGWLQDFYNQMGIGGNNGGYASGYNPTVSHNTEMANFANADFNALGAGNVPGLYDNNTALTPGTEGGWFGGEGGLGSLQGMGSLASAAGSLWGAYNGMQQLGLQEEMFDFNKGLTNANLLRQSQSANTDMRGRAKARYMSSGGAGNADNPYLAPDAYMEKNRISTDKIA